MLCVSQKHRLLLKTKNAVSVYAVVMNKMFWTITVSGSPVFSHLPPWEFLKEKRGNTKAE